MAKLGRWQGAGLLATTLLGTSVFILPQITIEIAKFNAIWAWVILTLAIVPVTLVFGRLSANFPHAAGPAYFVEQAFGPILGKAIGLIFLFAVPLGVPAAILMTYQFIDAIIPLNQTHQWLVQLTMLVSIFVVNYRGIQVSTQIQLLLTMLIVLVVLLMLFNSTPLTTSIHFNLPSTQQINPILIAAGLAFWSFLGVEAMSHLSDDFKHPKQDLLPAMLIGTILVGIVYVICTLILLWHPNQGALAMASVFNKLLGGHGQWVIGILGIAGGLATVNVYTASAAKLLASVANDGVLPRYFAHKNQYQVPARALVSILSIMACVITFTFVTGKNLEDLIFWVNGVFIVIYLAATFAAYKLLNKKSHGLVHLSVIFCFIVIYGLGWKMLYALTILSLLIPMLWLKQKKNKRVIV